MTNTYKTAFHNQEVTLPCEKVEGFDNGSEVLIYLPAIPPVVNSECYEWVDSSKVIG